MWKYLASLFKEPEGKSTSLSDTESLDQQPFLIN
jgi:hypothetical protein